MQFPKLRIMRIYWQIQFQCLLTYGRILEATKEPLIPLLSICLLVHDIPAVDRGEGDVSLLTGVSIVWLAGNDKRGLKHKFG